MGFIRGERAEQSRRVLFTPFDWLFRKLGPRYPKAFVTVELQAGFLVTAGTVALIGAFYGGSLRDYALMLAVALALTVGAIAYGLRRIYPMLAPISRWIAGERDPETTDRAWAAAVGLPVALIRPAMVWPVLGVVVPSCAAGVAIFDLSPLSLLPLLAAGLIAVGYGAILHHLTLELGMRPILVAINRAAPPRLEAGVAALPLRVRLLVALPMINVITGLVVAAITGGGSLWVAVVAAIGVATTISLELTILLTRSIMQPLADLKRATDALRRGDLEAVVPVTTADELGDLAASFNGMVAGLRERERIREAFGTYLDHEVAEHILSESFSERGDVVEVSILFCDVREFTRFAASARAREVVACLNALFEVVVPVVAAEGGHVDKFEGDGLMAVFGAPQRFPDPSDRAVRAAIEIDQLVNHEGRGGELEVGMGVNTGRVLAASIGGAGRLNFSVIGDAVNVASRVEAETRETGDHVLITAHTRERLTTDIDLEPRGERQLRGVERPIALYGLPGEQRDSLLDPVGAVRAVYARVRGHRGEV